MQSETNKSALIRTCDICGKVNAISSDTSEKSKKDLEVHDHTIKVVSLEEANLAWQSAGRCDHDKLIKELRDEIEFLKNLLL